MYLLLLFVFLSSCHSDIKNEIEIAKINQNMSEGNARVELSIKTDTGKQMSFTLKNIGNLPIFLAYLRSENIQNEETFDLVPYNLQCIEKGKKDKTIYNPSFHFAPLLAMLEAHREIEFVVNKPDITGECIVSVMYYNDIKVVELINNKNPFLSDLEKEVVDNSQKFVKLNFMNP